MAGRRKPLSQGDRHRQIMLRFDEMAWACYLRCTRGGLSQRASRQLALDDMEIRAKVQRGEAIKLRTTRP